MKTKEMTSGLLMNHPLPLRILILFALFFAGNLVFGLLALLFIPLLTGTPYSDVLTQFDNPSTEAMKWMQAFSAVGGFIAAPLLYTRIRMWKTGEVFGRASSMDLLTLALVLLLFVAVHPTIDFTVWLSYELPFPSFLKGLEELLRQTDMRTMEGLKRFTEMEGPGDLALNALILVIIPAVGEEFFFRGVLQRELVQSGVKIGWAVVMSALVFAVLHMQFFNFAGLFLMGILLGWIYALSGNLWYSIAGHFINNAGIVLALYMGWVDKEELEPSGIHPDWLYVFLSVVLSGLLIAGITKRTKGRKFNLFSDS